MYILLLMKFGPWLKWKCAFLKGRGPLGSPVHERLYGCFHKWEDHFVGVLMVRALLFGACTRPSDSWKLLAPMALHTQVFGLKCLK